MLTTQPDPVVAVPENASPASQVVGSFAKNSRERVTGSLYTLGGRRFASLRVTVPKGSNGSLFLSKGLTVSADQLPALRRLVESLEQAARDAGTRCVGIVPADATAPR